MNNPLDFAVKWLFELCFCVVLVCGINLLAMLANTLNLLAMFFTSIFD